MLKELCATCGQKTPLNDSFVVRGVRYCRDCATAQIDRSPFESEVTIGVDPTICSWCGEDNGRYELGFVADRPACDICENRMRKHPFPGWIQGAFLLLFIAAVVSMFWNARYVRALGALRAANTSFNNGDNEGGAAMLAQARKLVPESPLLQARGAGVQNVENPKPQNRQLPNLDALRQAMKDADAKREEARRQEAAKKAAAPQLAPAPVTPTPTPAPKPSNEPAHRLTPKRNFITSPDRRPTLDAPEVPMGPGFGVNTNKNEGSDDPFADPSESDPPGKSPEPESAPKSPTPPPAEDDPFSRYHSAPSLDFNSSRIV